MERETIENEKLEMAAEIKKRAKDRISKAVENHRIESELQRVRMRSPAEIEQEEKLLANIASKLNIDKEMSELLSIRKARGERWKAALEKKAGLKTKEGN